MVSHEDLIYNFADVYMKTAVECSVCKENYTMTDDREFFDEYLKILVGLISVVEVDTDLQIDDLKQTLEKQKEEALVKFQNFLRRKTIEKSIESVQKLQLSNTGVATEETYIGELQKIYHQVFDEESENVKNDPVQFLRYVRTKEEQ